MNKYKLKLIVLDNKIVNFFDKEISSEKIKEFDNILWYKYSEKLFGIDTIKNNYYIKNEPFEYSNKFNIYNNLNKLINYNIITKYFLIYNEIMNKFNIIKNKSTNLILSTCFLDDSLSVIESIKYNNIIKNIKTTNYINSCILYNQFKNGADIAKQGNIKLKYELLKSYIKKINYINNTISTKSLKSKKKYDNIISNLQNYKDLTPNFYEIDNIGLVYFSLLYSIINLKKNGNVIIRTLINKKITCDIILIFSQYFEKYEIYNSDIYNNIKYNSYFICFYNYKSSNESDINNLTNIFKEILKKNKGLNNFNIINNNIRLRYNINRTILLHHQFNYLHSLIDENINSQIYKPFFNFNNNIYTKKIKYINNLINNYNKKNIITKKDKYKIALYAKQNNLKINIKTDIKNIFTNYIKNIIDKIFISNIIKLNNNTNNNNNNNNISFLKYSNFNTLLYSLYSNIDNNITLSYLDEKTYIKNNLFYPKYMHIQLAKYLNNKYKTNIRYKSYTDWINLYEIIKKYNFNIENTISECSNINEIDNIINYILNERNKKIKKNNNNKYKLYIGNCSNTKNKNSTDFIYYFYISKLYKIKFNYIGDYNIITIYYDKNYLYFSSKILSKLLKYDLNKDFIERYNTNHTLNFHVDEDITKHHAHIKVKIDYQYTFLSKLFKLTEIDINNIDNIKKAEKTFTENNTIRLINFKNKSYAKNILKVIKQNIDDINLFKFKKEYFKNIQKLKNLSKNGNAIIKFSLPLIYKYELDLIYKLYINFNNIEFYKPTYLSYLNEYYIICKKFNNNNMTNIKLNKDKLNKKNILNYDKVFITKINNSFNSLYNTYNNLVNNYNILIKYQNILEKKKSIINKYNNNNIEKWINNFLNI